MKTNKRNKRKLYLWLPYLENIETKPKSAYFKYKGGETKIQWTKIHSIMIYGCLPDISQDFLEKCCFYKIPIVIHRRNLPKAVFITPTISQDRENILTKQILYRENEKKKSYIAKRLLWAKFKSTSWLLPIKRDLLYKETNLEKMISIESWHARIYWKKYFESLKIEGSRRSNENTLRKILDAASKFISGIILRWILYHGLSPYHGFLHKPTEYPALVYDLMEPYRGYIEKVIFDTIKENRNEDESKILAYSIENIKNFLDQKIYVEATRQVVTFQELFHGIVLALRNYLLGETSRFIPPIPSKPNGGRPIKAGYKLYGHKAGITNFWPETKKISAQFEKLYFLS